MPDPNNSDAESGKQLTAAEAAKRVKRTEIEMVEVRGPGGKVTKQPKAKRVPVEAGEVLSFRDYGTHVVVVTRDGQKLSSADD
ncbi:hypothetical protein ACF8PL_25155 [Delftia sp. WSY_4]|uniref:hypothetical protein n=1 Tax=unclassified Delftia TaxID=2613839 RepID=UPI00370A70BD